MAWKDVPVGETVNNKIWVNEGLPGVKTKINPFRGFHINIPTIDGGVSTPLNFDDSILTKLSDENILTDVYYNGNYYTLTTGGNAVGLELTGPCSVQSIDMYVNAYTGVILPANTLHILISADGTNWSRVSSILTTNITYTCETNYGVISIALPTPITSKFIAIRSTANFNLNFGGGDFPARFRELQLFTPEDFGINEDAYINKLTGHMYEKNNGLWQLTYTAPEIPQHLVGSSMIPPSAAGRPIGSFYIVQNS